MNSLIPVYYILYGDLCYNTKLMSSPFLAMITRRTALSPNHFWPCGNSRANVSIVFSSLSSVAGTSKLNLVLPFTFKTARQIQAAPYHLWYLPE